MIRMDLTNLFNHKFIYEKECISQSEVGIENTYILRDMIDIQDFNISKVFLDNIICDNQHLPINKRVNKIHMLGFAYFGSTNTLFQIVYENNFIEYVKIPFIDWVKKYNSNYQEASIYGTSIKTIKQINSIGKLSHIVNFHHSITNINQKLKIKEIIFPDNFLVHIFGVNIEEYEEVKE